MSNQDINVGGGYCRHEIPFGMVCKACESEVVLPPSNTQQYPEHILKQANKLAVEAAESILSGSVLAVRAKIIRDTLNLPALLMAREERDSLQKEIEPLRDLKSDADKELADYAERAARGFIANAKKELDVLMNAYIGHTGGLKYLVEQLSQHQQVVKQLVEALEAMFSEMNFEETKILIRTGLNVKYESVKQVLSTAKQLLEKKV